MPRGTLVWVLLLPLAAALSGCGEMAGSVPLARATSAETDRLAAPAATGSGDEPAFDAAAPQAGAAAAARDSIDESRRTAIVRAAERVAPAVVSVNVIRREAVQARTLWEGFFIPRGEREVAGLGSGFIIREDGLVLTNEHVVRGASQVVVTLADGREFEADLIGTDDLTDLALVRIRAGRRLPVAPLGESDRLLIGEWVVAIGNPLGYLISNYEPTVTAGVVSGVGRNIIRESDEDRSWYLDMIQTDASINPGNSGGPLVNALGEVVGVNSSIFSRSGGSEGLGFAIPISRARRIAMELLENGRVRRAWVGLQPEAAEVTRSGRASGVRIANVAPGSPAAGAGLRAGMVLKQVAGRPIRTTLDWEAALLDAQVGRSMEVAVSEGTRERVIRLVPGDVPSLTAERIRALADFELVTLTPSIRAERGVVSERGALIVSLSEIARQIGLREGDVVLQINRTPVQSAEEAARLFQRWAGRGPVRVFFERRSQAMSVSFTIS